MRALGGEDGAEEGWAKVRIDGRDWGRVLSVGRLSPKVVACKYIVVYTTREMFTKLPKASSMKRR